MSEIKAIYELIPEWIEANPKQEGVPSNDYYQRVAEAHGIAYNNAKNRVLNYLKYGKAVTSYKGKKKKFKKTSTTKSEFTPDKGYMEGKSTKRITSVAEAVAFFEIDTEIWSVEKVKCNAWDVTMKLDDGPGTQKRAETKTNYQVAVWLKPKQEGLMDIDFTSIFEKIQVKPSKVKPEPVYQTSIFDRLIYTDVHIGMETNPDGTSLYGLNWNEELLMERAKMMIDLAAKNQRSNTLYIDELGDLMDGWDGKTVRREHDLPQNMTNQEAYDAGVRFKCYIIDGLASLYSKIVCHNVCVDNHAGAFGYVVNQGFKKYIEAKYPGHVEVHNQIKFIDHYQVGDFVFLLCHGKDDKNMRTGFKPVLDKDSKEKIDNYLYINELESKRLRIEFNKGDSHQYLKDWSVSQKFHYENFFPLSPASNWGQTNFKPGRSGFVFRNYLSKASVSETSYVFNDIGSC